MRPDARDAITAQKFPLLLTANIQSSLDEMSFNLSRAFELERFSHDNIEETTRALSRREGDRQARRYRVALAPHIKATATKLC